ncbi:Scm-like with four MBT domains protein 2 [Nibea albiflora]|uniref:Scm-like with four MBT domains protein 2 n=1 Tax=Nibea albiflora TaxID=240163 RepID=A0ACB7EUA8_NIBAL|nr:Scm-like with four MBT domains protein 2 [Nibea albiflora]
MKERRMRRWRCSREARAPARSHVRITPTPPSVEVTSSRPRRAVTLRRAFSAGNTASSRELPEGRRRSTRSLSAYNQSNKYQPPKGQDMQVQTERRHTDGGSTLTVVEEEGQLVLDRNPLEWSVDEVVQFINSTDCASLANIFQEQDIDGQALLLLTLPTVQECMDLKLGPAIKLCHQIERVKVAFYKQYAN